LLAAPSTEDCPTLAFTNRNCPKVLVVVRFKRQNIACVMHPCDQGRVCREIPGLVEGSQDNLRHEKPFTNLEHDTLRFGN